MLGTAVENPRAEDWDRVVPEEFRGRRDQTIERLGITVCSRMSRSGTYSSRAAEPWQDGDVVEFQFESTSTSKA
jgi:hypothetical protein